MLVNTNITPNVNLAISSFLRQDFFPTFGKVSDIPMTSVKFTFPGQVLKEITVDRPDDVHRSRPHFGILAHDGHTRCERAINAEHSCVSVGRQNGQIEVTAGMITSDNTWTTVDIFSLSSEHSHLNCK